MKNKLLFLLCLSSFNFITTENRTPDQEQALQKIIRKCLCTSLFTFSRVNDDKNIEKKMETFLSEFKCHELRDQILEEVNAIEIIGNSRNNLKSEESKDIKDLRRAHLVKGREEYENKSLLYRANISEDELSKIMRKKETEFIEYLKNQTN